MASSTVAAVEISSEPTANSWPKTTSVATIKKSVSAAGRARVRMFVIKWPAIRFLFGISESRKPGIPIVNILISEIWDGSSGYVTIEISEKMDSRNEKMFFTRNSVPERCRLLTTRRPSSTTEGIFEKSLSSRTSCAACAAASLPDAIATEQSASFNASTSLTPSPVIATVLPFFFKAWTNCRFWSGVTRPNTVYFRIASSSSSGVFRVEASI